MPEYAKYEIIHPFVPLVRGGISQQNAIALRDSGLLAKLTKMEKDIRHGRLFISEENEAFFNALNLIDSVAGAAEFTYAWMPGRKQTLHVGTLKDRCHSGGEAQRYRIESFSKAFADFANKYSKVLPECKALCDEAIRILHIQHDKDILSRLDLVRGTEEEGRVGEGKTPVLQIIATLPRKRDGAFVDAAQWERDYKALEAVLAYHYPDAVQPMKASGGFRITSTPNEGWGVLESNLARQTREHETARTREAEAFRWSLGRMGRTPHNTATAAGR